MIPGTLPRLHSENLFKQTLHRTIHARIVLLGNTFERLGKVIIDTVNRNRLHKTLHLFSLVNSIIVQFFKILIQSLIHSVDPSNPLYASPMRVGLAVSSDKFTGAAAVAEHWCRALHLAGHDARLLFVAGANLERRLSCSSWALPDLKKERRPTDIRSNFRALRLLATWADVVMTFLPHDHFEAVLAGAHTRAPLIRAFRNPRHLRRDRVHRWAFRRCAAVLTPFCALIPQAKSLIGNRPVTSITVPVEDRFRPSQDTGKAKSLLGIDPDGPVIGMVGKLAQSRGFEILLDAAAKANARCRILAIGHGEHQPALESRAQELGIAERVIWAGKREDDLPLLFSAMDAVVFAAPGSDWGHRAISEAQACGRPVITLPISGVEDLVLHEYSGLVAEDSQGIASAFNRLIENPVLERRLECAASQAGGRRRFGPIGRQLGDFLEGLRQPQGSPSGGPR